jgi:hypothetical protein
MKAKDIFKNLEIEDIDKSIEYRVINSIRKMILEVHEIRTQRRVNNDESLKKIFHEQNRKCRAFVQLVNSKYKLNIIDDAFFEYIKDSNPSLYEMIK